MLINPQVYAQVGLDPEAGGAGGPPQPAPPPTRRWMAEKIMAFLAEQGMVTGPARADLPAVPT